MEKGLYSIEVLIAQSELAIQNFEKKKKTVLLSISNGDYNTPKLMFIIGNHVTT